MSKPGYQGVNTVSTLTFITQIYNGSLLVKIHNGWVCYFFLPGSPEVRLRFIVFYFCGGGGVH